MGYFNAKLERKEENNNDKIGLFDIDKRNNRSWIMMNFLEQNNLYGINTIFEKKQKERDWISPKMQYNETNYNISSHKNNLINVSVLNKFSTRSSHRLVRSNIEINYKLERSKRITTKTPKLNIIRLEENTAIY